MSRAKKDGRVINYKIDRLLYERFAAYCEEKGQTATLALERILKEYLDKYDESKNKKTEE